MVADTLNFWRLFGIERHHQLLLKWLIITVATVFGAAAAQYFGLFAEVISSDRSRISIAIMVLFVLTAIHCAVRTFEISSQLNQTAQAAQQIKAHPEYFALADDGVVVGNGERLQPSLLTDHVRDLIIKSAVGREAPLDSKVLLETMEARLKGRQEIGWFVSDQMLRLGLLGTVIGFILMLGPLIDIESIDISSMRAVLSAMSSGMAVALYTTLVGLIGAILVKVQYYFLENTTDELVALTSEVSDVLVVPALQGRRLESRHAS